MSKFVLIVALLLAACSSPQTRPDSSTTTAAAPLCPAPPIAEVRPKTNELHGTTWEDPYFWLRERDAPEVREYLEAENAYAAAHMRPTDALQTELYEEMLSHIDENELSAPVLRGGYWYYSRNEEGKSYEIHCRKKTLDGPEEVILDENKLAEGKEYFAVGVFQPSPDGRLLAYSTDEVGNERYTLRVLNLDTGEHLPTTVSDAYYSLAWANDNKTLFYDRVDDATRPYQLYRHVLGTPSSEDVLVYEETDERFFLSVERTRSEQMLLLSLESAVTTEVRYLDASTPTGEFAVIAPRKQDVEYRVDHHSDRFYIVSNEGAVNFRLFEAKLDDLDRKSWTELIPERDDVTLRAVDAFANHLAIWERAGGLARLRIRDLANAAEHEVEFPESAYAAWRSANYTFDTTTMRFAYSSLVTPRSVFDYDMVTRERSLVKQKDVPNYDASLYETARINATTWDGTLVPISLVWRKGARDDGPAPLLLEGYGSYGANYDPYFASTNLHLLDRGMILGIAHIRGGGENGRRWYDAGKYLNKKNTFTDFIAAAAHLVALDYTRPDRLAIAGRSAGGLLMGAVANMRPDLFAVVVAGVPFVDVLNTMLDPSIPLTVTEWEEWGNPNDPAYFEYIKSYAPYENIEAVTYPDMLVTAGLNDPRVAYWEPAKWVARMRATAKPDNTLLLKTNMGAGHGGSSGRYDYLKEIAFEDAFVLRHLGIAATSPACGGE